MKERVKNCVLNCFWVHQLDRAWTIFFLAFAGLVSFLILLKRAGFLSPDYLSGTVLSGISWGLFALYIIFGILTVVKVVRFRCGGKDCPLESKNWR